MGHTVRAGHPARQRPITYAVGALLGVVLLLGLAPAASDATPPRSSFPGATGTVVDWSGDGLVPSERYRGSTRFDTASLIAREGFDPSDAVLIARGDAFPDSLAGNYLAGQLGAPVLLTHTSFVPDETRAAIEDLGARHAFILGGPDAVSEAVADQLRAMGLNVGRIAGLHRYATAAAIATQPGTTVGFLNGRRTAIVASGETFPDALVAGAVAFAAEFPLLLTPQGSLHPDTAEALESRAITQVIIPGGPVAVSETVAAQLRARGITVVRVSGEDRVATAVAIARFARDQLGWGTEVLNFAVGTDFPDALSLGARAGLIRSPVLLTRGPETLDSPAAALTPFLEALGCEVELVRVAGGPVAVSGAVELQIRRLATEDSACDLALAPSEATNQAGTDHSVTATVAGHAVDRLPDVPVRFEVYRSIDGGDNFGAVPVVTATVTSDDDGEATLDYDGPATSAVDRIVACVDGDADGCATVTAGNVVTDTDDVADTADATWQAGAPATLALTPAADTNTVGEAHRLTATVADGSDNAVPGAEVTFEVYRSTDGGASYAGAPVETGTDTTDADGEATFTYTSQVAPATDRIVACVEGGDADTRCASVSAGAVTPDPDDVSDTATKTWEADAPASVTLTPADDTNPVATEHTLTALVEDRFGNDLPGHEVTFEVYRSTDGGASYAGTPVATGTDTTDADGEATFTYTGPDELAIDRIVACMEGADEDTTCATVVDGTVTSDPDDLSDTATKTWAAGDPTALVLEPEDGTNTVGEDHTVTATLTDSFGNLVSGATVRFEVTGDGTPEPASGTAVTTADGTATFTFTNEQPGDNTITACTDEDGTEPDTCVAATGPSDTATKTWEIGDPATLVLEPDAGTNAVGEDHTVTATLTDSFGNPVPGAGVRFEVTGDGTPTPASGTDTTDADGEATFTFTNEQPGDNTITACTNDDGTQPATCDDATGLTDTATKTWQVGDPTTLVLDPDNDTNTIGEDHTVTATVTDSFGNPVPGAGVRFEVAGDDTPDPDFGTATTDVNGEATFTFTNESSGTNTITACTNDDGSLPTSCGEADGPSDDASKVWEPIAASLELTPEAEANEVGESHTVTATVTGPGPDDVPVQGAVVRFEVTGDGTPDPASGTAITNADGEATFTFTNESTGDNTITACTDEDATEPASCAAATGPSDTATKTWTAGAPAMLTLTPESATNSLNADHTVTATVTDGRGNPVPNASVRFEVWRGNDLTPTASPAEGTSQTDENGEVTFTYSSSAEGSDVVFACTTSDGTAPDSCSTDGETVAPGLIGDTADKHWAEPDTLSLEPSTGTNQVGEDHTVTATVTGDGRRLAGAEVRFEVTGTVTLTEVVTTDANGEASFTYTSEEPGDDTITACTDPDGSEPTSCAGPTGPSDTATKTWEPGEPDMLVLDPETTTNTIGEDHTVTATVTDSFGNPVPGAAVRFEVTGDGGPTPDSGTDTTDANGEATFTFTNAESGTNTITACTNDDGSLPTSCGEADGPSDTTGKVWEPIAQSLELTPEAETNEVGALHTVTATVTDPDGAAVQGAIVRFEVTGDGTPDPDSGTAITNADGEATFTFTNEATGDNTITACTDEDATAPSACADATGPSDTATKTWTAGPPTMLTLTPETSTNTVGSDHTVTATLTDGFGNPVPGAMVRFEVDSDGDATPASGTGTSDADGQATFTFSNSVAGTDTITACTNGDGSLPASCATATGPDDIATKRWMTAPPAEITLEPSTDLNGVAEDHMVTATVLDADGQPVQGAVVRFEVTGDGTPDPADGTAVTDVDGNATFTFTNDTPGQNSITACSTADGSDPGSCTTADPQLTATATKTWEQRAATVTLEPDTDTNAVGSDHTVTATILDGAGQPMEGVRVRFDVFRDGQTSRTTDGPGVTDVNGEATFTYTGPTGPADDVIWACVFEGATGDETTIRPSHCTGDNAGQQARADVVADTAAKAWETPAPQTLTLTPATDSKPRGTPHTVTATVLDQFGDPLEGANVLFEVSDDGVPDPASGTDTTDADGEATFTFTNELPLENTITACTNNDGTLPASCGAATGPSGTATVTWTPT